MRVLITGGAGYVGTRLSNQLARLGHSVRVLDTLIYGNLGLHPWIELKVGDITRAEDVRDATTGIDVVVHLAAISNDPTGDLDEALTERVNVGGTQTLLAAAKAAGVKRFVFASSSSVLGIQDEENVTEETPPNPITAYSRSKLRAERDVLDAASSRFTTVAIRPATICGPSPRQRFDLAVNALTGSAFFEEKITVYGGQQRRPNLTIDDMIRLYQLMLELPDELICGEIFNVGWENMTILQMAEAVQSQSVTSTGELPNIDVRDAAADQRDYHITSNKIEEQLGFRPAYGITDMVDALRKLMEMGYIGNHRKSIYHNLKVLNRRASIVPSSISSKLSIGIVSPT